MLDFDVTKKEDSIEELVCNPMREMKKTTMDDELFSLLLGLSTAKVDKRIPQDEKPFIFQLIEKRILACFTFSISDDRAILVLCMVAVSPGKAVMYLWYIQWWCFTNNVQEVDFTTLCSRIFPNGFFCEEDLKTVWDNQKVKRPAGSMCSDNLLDYGKAGFSIQFKEA